MRGDGWGHFDAAEQHEAGAEKGETRRIRRGPGKGHFVLPAAILVSLAAALLFMDLNAEREAEDDEGAPADHDDNAEEVFDRAREVLEEGGSFAYRGTTTSEVLVDGEVVLPDRLHEVGIGPDGRAYELIAIGEMAWKRSAAMRDGLAATEFMALPEEQVESPALHLPDLLANARLPRREGVDWLGQERYRATIERASSEAELRLGLDWAGAPAFVDVVAGAGGGATTFNLRLARIGEPMRVELGDELDGWVSATARQAEAAGIRHPVALNQVPAQWALDEATLVSGRGNTSCTTLALTYRAAPRPTARFYLYVRSPGCPAPRRRPGELMATGDFTGTISEQGDTTVAVLSDGTTELIAYAHLPLETVTSVLQSLGPYEQ